MEFKPRKFRIQAYDSFTRSQSISTNRRVSSIHCVEKYAKLCSLPDFDNFLRFSQDELESNLNQVGDFFGKILKHCGVQAAATGKGGLHLPASQQVRWVMSYFLMQRRHLGIFQVQINRPKLELLSSVKKPGGHLTIKRFYSIFNMRRLANYQENHFPPFVMSCLDFEYS